MISYDDFQKIELRIGKILEVSVHPNADKLYLVKVDIGEKTVQLVAGIRQFYTEDELKGKLVAVLTNLEPREIRGVASEGMLLAGKSDTALSILTAEKDLPPGSIIK